MFGMLMFADIHHSIIIYDELVSNLFCGDDFFTLQQKNDDCGDIYL